MMLETGREGRGARFTYRAPNQGGGTQNEPAASAVSLWHVVYCTPRSELEVAHGIGQNPGFPVYLPLEQMFVLRRGHRVKDTRPLFSRYLFVQVDPARQDWQRLLDVSGVVDVLMASDTVPGCVPNATIEALQKAEDVGLFDHTNRLPNNFKIGEMVKVADGAFEGHNALITEFAAKMRSATAKKRAKLLVKFMGRMVTVDLPVTSLGKL